MIGANRAFFVVFFFLFTNLAVFSAQAGAVSASLLKLLQTPAGKILMTRTPEGVQLAERVLGLNRIRGLSDYEQFLKKLTHEPHFRKPDFQNELSARLESLIRDLERTTDADEVYRIVRRFGSTHFRMHLDWGGTPQFFNGSGQTLLRGQEMKLNFLRDELITKDLNRMDLPEGPFQGELSGQLERVTLVIHREYLHSYSEIVSRLENLPWRGSQRWEAYGAIDGALDRVGFSRLRTMQGVHVFNGKTMDEVKLMSDFLPIEHLK